MVTTMLPSRPCRGWLATVCHEALTQSSALRTASTLFLESELSEWADIFEAHEALVSTTQPTCECLKGAVPMGASRTSQPDFSLCILPVRCGWLGCSPSVCNFSWEFTQEDRHQLLEHLLLLCGWGGKSDKNLNTHHPAQKSASTSLGLAAAEV
jgi:hypothetical protein